MRTSNRKKTATMLQRQCVAALSSLALNSTGKMVRPATREAVERGLLFMAAFHWSKSVRGEANLALRRQQSQRNLPHPSAWGVQDCLKWLSCVDLDQMCTAANIFLDSGKPVVVLLTLLPMLLIARGQSRGCNQLIAQAPFCSSIDFTIVKQL